MYYGRKKGIIIAIIVIVLVILLAVGGLFVYINTDLFKSNETLFLKYIAKQYEEINVNYSNTQLEDMLNAKKQMPYETNATLKVNYNDAEDSSESINEELKKMQIGLIVREDMQNDKQYSNLKVFYDDINLVDLHYAKSNDIYALKWEEIVAKYFVGVKNENLKAFAQKLGVQDTNQIPDKINEINYTELLKITAEEKEHIFTTYFNVLLNNILPEKYTKQKDMMIAKDGVNYETTAYRLDLSSEELKNISIKILEELQQDSITLNLITIKSKMLGLSEEYTTINGIQKQLQEKINNLNTQTVDTSKGLSIVVYEYKGEVIQTEVILKNEMKLTMTSSNNNSTKTIKLVIDNLSDSEDYTNIVINLTSGLTSSNTIINLGINVNNNQAIALNMNSAGIASQDKNVQTTMDLSIINEEEQNIQVTYKGKTVFESLNEEILELSNSNCVVLNNYPTQDLQNLIKAIVGRLGIVFTQKMQTIGLIPLD